MKKYKILNLYACLGGNRYKWDLVAQQAGVEIEVTAVELDPELARLYKERFPNDIVIIADAHQYLLDHYKEFDFIWSSPPCPTHSKIRISQKNRENFKAVFPDMMLYEEVIFLENYFKGKYVVENVDPYYEPLINPQKRGRHIYWANFKLPLDLVERKMFKNMIEVADIKQLSEFHDYDFTKYKGEQRLNKIARNLVDYEAGKTIFETALGIINKPYTKQAELFL
jgi:DNA (cytosine-5)-methyltransferase 1